MRLYTNDRQSGFTIVELIVVIIAIGVLATLAIFGYNGVQDHAREVSIKSDLEGASGQLEREYQKNGSYPSTLTSARLLASSTTVYTYLLKGDTYCLSATSSKGKVGNFFIRGDDTKIKEGVCQVEVTTFAGTGTAGFVNGTVTTAQFGFPYGIVEDSVGNIYVADGSYHTIRKIDSAGNVSNFAGTYTQGFVNATGTTARFSQPYGLAIDGSDNIYVADRNNHSIRKITPAGVVTTLAGTGVAGNVNGAGTVAQFSIPTDIAIDQSNILYVTDQGNNVIRKITPAGVVSTFAGSGTAGGGNGTGTAAQFSSPSGITVGSAGEVYVTETAGHRIRKITPAGVVSTFAGNGVNGFADATALLGARFDQPAGVAVDSTGTVYVADTNNRRIRKILASGVTTYAGNGVSGRVDGPAATARFVSPYSIYVTRNGMLLVSDSNARVVRKIQ